MHLDLGDAVATAQLLEQLTVSLDRIGSRQADGWDAGSMLTAFVAAADVVERCSVARQPLWDAIDAVKGEGTSEALGEGIRYYPEVGGEAVTRDPWRSADHDHTDLPGTFVVEIGVRQAWPFIGFCDNRFAVSRELRLYLDAPWRVGDASSGGAADLEAWLTAAEPLNGLTVEAAVVEADGSLHVEFLNGPTLRVPASNVASSAGESWWLTPTA